MATPNIPLHSGTSGGIDAANSSTGYGDYGEKFIPELWSLTLNAKFYAKTMLGEIANLNWEGELKKMGESVRIRTAPDITINDYEVGTDLSAQIPQPTTTDLEINKGKYFNVQTHDVIAQQADLDLMDMFAEDANKQMKIKVEVDTFFQWFVTEGADSSNKGATAGKESGIYNLGTDAAPVDQATDGAVLDTILNLAAALDEQNVPEEGRWLLISPADRKLLMKTDIAQAYFTGDSSSTIRTGKIGMIDRFTVYLSNLLPKGAAGKALVKGTAATSSGASASGAKARRMMVAGTGDACAFASTITKVEELRNQKDFGDLVRGLMIFGHKVVQPKALATALVGTA